MIPTATEQAAFLDLLYRAERGDWTAAERLNGLHPDGTPFTLGSAVELEPGSGRWFNVPITAANHFPPEIARRIGNVVRPKYISPYRGY